MLARVAGGELSALGVLYDRHQLSVLRFAQRVTRNASDAEDIVQETFLSAARSAASFDGRDSCRPWLLGIAAHALMHRNRTSARIMRLVSRVTELSTSQPAFVDPAARHDARSQLDVALSKLTPEKRIALVMAEVEGMTCEEIARTLSIPVGTASTRLHHARRELQKHLARRER